MRYAFILPGSFDPLEFLKAPRLAMRADDARWLMSTIVRKTANRDTDPWGCVRLHTSILRTIMSPNAIAAIVKALERGGAIELAPHYPGVKCKGYRLGRRYLGDRHVIMPATDPRLIERIEQARREQETDQRSRRQVTPEQRERLKATGFQKGAQPHAHVQHTAHRDASEDVPDEQHLPRQMPLSER